MTTLEILIITFILSYVLVKIIKHVSTLSATLIMFFIMLIFANFFMYYYHFNRLFLQYHFNQTKQQLIHFFDMIKHFLQPHLTLLFFNYI